MNKTKEEMSEMAEKKTNSKRTVDRLVADELLKMGFSYSYMGTHYLHDSIVYAVEKKLEYYTNIRTFCNEITNKVSTKYGVTPYQCSTECVSAINKAFVDGNIDYILEVFKESYNRDKMTVGRIPFIMTLRNKILSETEEQRNYNVTQLRIIIQGELEGVSDVPVLEGIWNILLSLKGERFAVV